jgi:hypothetical protein
MPAQTIIYDPRENHPFEFDLILDGKNCIARIKGRNGVLWLDLFTQSNVLIFRRPVVASSDYSDISLCAGFFKSVFIYREATGAFEIDPIRQRKKRITALHNVTIVDGYLHNPIYYDRFNGGLIINVGTK